MLWQVVHVFDVLFEEVIERISLREQMFMDAVGALVCWLTFSNVASNAGAAGVARCFFNGAAFAVALDEPLLFSTVTSVSDGGADYPVC